MTHADPGILYVDGASGQDIPTCGTTGSPCETISYTLNGRAIGGDTIRVAQGVYTENLTVDKRVTLEGGYEAVGWTRSITQCEAIIDGSNSRTVWGDWDGSQVVKPAVISDGTEYKMWFDGRNLLGEAQVGLAASSDGISWTKYPTNPVLTGTAGAWDEYDEHAPFVLKEGGIYKMWYEGRGDDVRQLGYATSTNGIDWNKYTGNPVLRAGPESYDQDIAGHGSVLNDGGTYKLWYLAGGDGGGIAYATSPDGLSWTKQGPVLTSESGNWDDGGLWGPSVLKVNGSYWMWYAAWGWEGWTAVGVVTSTNGITWTRFLAAPVITETGWVGDPHVISDGGKLKMWYNVWHEDGTGDIAYAESDDGISWTKSPSNPVLMPGTSGQWGQPVMAFTSGSDSSVLDGFTVRNGEAEYGGGIYVDGIQVTVQNCQIASNTAYHAGGGIAARHGASVVIRSNDVLSNLSQETGGAGLLVDGGTATVDGNLFAYNVSQAWWGGDALGFWDANAVTVTNNIVVSNTSKGIGTGVNATVVNNTIAYNLYDGLFVWEVTAPVAINNIAFNNGTAYDWACDINADGGGQILVADYNNAGTYCNDAVTGTHDISGDPLFVDVANGNYHLQVGSPCIDAGTSDGAPDTDFDGMPRDAMPDIGAYEWTGFRIFLPLTLRNAGQ